MKHPFAALLACGMTLLGCARPLPAMAPAPPVVESSPAATPASAPAAAPQPEAAAPAPAASAVAVDFTKDVRPILARRCTPCHEPGGKMYERLPFDQARTIREHPEGVLRRIKEPEEKATLEAFLASPSS